MESLTMNQYYRAMYFFLDIIYVMKKSDDLGGLLGSIA